MAPLLGRGRLADERTRAILTVISVTTLINFMAGYNARLAVVGIPTIAHDLGADIWGMTWIIQGYMLGSTFIQLVVGRLSDLFGRVRLFNIGIAVFTIGALSSGLSSSPYQLALSRILQGVGGAFLMSLTVTILTDNVPPGSLGRWLGINQVTWRAGALVGLTASGLIIDYMGWRWIFLTQVPIGLFTLYWSWRALREVYRPREPPRVDWTGFALFTSSTTLLLISLTLTGYGYEVFSRELLTASLVLLLVFIVWELRTETPALDLTIFRSWQFTGGIIAQILYSIGFGATLTLLAIYMQSVDRLDPATTGLLLTPFELVFLVTGVVGGWLSDKIGFAPVTVAGLTISSTGLLLLYNMRDIASLVVGEAVFAVGTGLFVSPNTSSIMLSVPPERRGVASSIRTLSFNIGFLLSLNLAILSMTSYIPYKIASQLITLGSLGGSPQVIEVELRDLDIAIRRSFLVQSLVMASAIPFSLSRIGARAGVSRRRQRPLGT